MKPYNLVEKEFSLKFWSENVTPIFKLNLGEPNDDFLLSF